MPECPQCHLKFRSVVYRKVWPPHNGRFQADSSWRETLECGHLFTRTAKQVWSGVATADRRACAECLDAHQKEIGVA